MESEDHSSSELWLDGRRIEQCLQSVVGVLTGRNIDFTDQSETARSSKLRMVSRHPTVPLLVMSLLSILRVALLVAADDVGPVDGQNRSNRSLYTQGRGVRCIREQDLLYNGGC